MGALGSFKSLVRGFDSQVWSLFVAEIISVLGTSIIRTFLAIFMYKEMGMSMTEVGVAFFVTSLVGAIASYMGGMISDAWGRKKLLVTGLALQVLVYLLLSLVTGMHVSYLLFVAVLALSSLVGDMYRPVPEVMIADVVKPDLRVEAYGLLRIGANLGWVIGPVLGGFLLIFIPFYWVFLITAFTTLVYLMIALFFLRDTRPSVKAEKLRLDDIRYIVADRPFLMYTLISAFMLIPYQQMYTLLSVYSSSYVGLSDFWIGVLFAESGIMVALSQYFVSRKVKNYRLTSMLALCTIVFAAGFSLLAVSTAFIMPFVCIGIATLAEMIWAPAGSTLQANLAPESRRGRYFGFSGLFSSLGFAIGPLFGGVLKDSVNNNIPSMWIVVSAMFILCGVGFLLLNRFVPEHVNAPAKKIEEKRLEAPIEA